MKLDINASKLAEGLAMTLPCAGKDAMLPTLVAVALHVREDGSVALVATNRYLLAEYVIPAEDVGRIDAEPCTVIVPSATVTEWIKLAKRAAKTWSSAATPVTLTVEGQTATLADYETSQSGRLVDGQHVSNWWRLFPEGDGGELAHVGIAPVNLAAIAKIATVAGKNATVRFDFHGEAKGVLFRVAGADSFRGVVMPVRVTDW